MATQTHRDEQLVHLAQQGDASAFEQLIHRYAGLVHSIARARLGNLESAEDLAQEVFLRAHLNLRQLRDPSRLAPWLSRLTRNLALDWLRRGTRRSQLVPMVSLDETTHQVPDTKTRGAREIMEAQEQGRTVQRAVDRLPSDQREVVLLHFGEDLTQREVAQRLGVSPVKVNRQIKRAVETLRGVVSPALLKATPALKTPARVATGSATLVFAAAAMPTAAKAALAVTAKTTAPAVSGMAANLGSMGLSTIAAKLAAGGAAMSAGKAAVAVTAVAVVAVVGYNQMKSTPSQSPDFGRATVEETFTPSATPSQIVEAVRLEVDYETGLEMIYHGQMEMTQDIRIDRPNAPPQRVDMTMALGGTTRVLERTPEGLMRLEESVDNIEITRSLINGEPVDLAALGALDQMTAATEMSAVSTIDRHGEVRGLEIGGGDADTDASAFIRELIVRAMCGYPDRPLQIGDTWSREFEIPGSEGIRATSTATLERIEERDGQRVAVITREARIDINRPLPLPFPPSTPMPLRDAQMQMMGLNGLISSESEVFIDGMFPISEVVDLTLRLPMQISGQSPRGREEISIGIDQSQRITINYEPPA